jgi:hypothetical protein
VTVISVPYHLDQYLSDLDWPVDPDATVTAAFPEGDPWERLASLSAASIRGRRGALLRRPLPAPFAAGYAA